MKRTIASLLAAILIISLFASCNGANNNSANPVSDKSESQAGGESKPSEENTAEEEPYNLRIFVPGNRGANYANDPILQELGRRLNMNIEILTAPWGEETSKINAILSEKESFDIIQAPDSPQGMPWAQDELLLDIAELIKGKESEYPYINSVLNAESFAGLKVDGKSYYLAGTHHGQDWCLYIRKDWLDKLNLPVPQTVDQLYDTMVAFRDQDPDGNGQKDTIAYQATLPAPHQFSEFDPLMHMFRGSFGDFFEDYLIVDGKVEPAEVSEGAKSGLLFINKLYREGLINADFPQLKDVAETNAKYLYANKSGIVWTSRISEFATELKKTNPDAQFVRIDPIGANGQAYLKSQGTAWWLLIGIPTTSANPEKALQFIEYCNSEEGRKLLVAGIEGVHYTKMENGVYDQNREQWEKDFDTKTNGYDYPLWYGFLTTAHGYIPCDKYPTYEEAMQNIEIYMTDIQAQDEFNWQVALKDGAMYNEPNPFHSVYIPEVVDQRNQIVHNVQAISFLKIITASSEAEALAAWDEYIANWKAAGGEDVVAAYQAYYDNNLK